MVRRGEARHFHTLGRVLCARVGAAVAPHPWRRGVEHGGVHRFVVEVQSVQVCPWSCAAAAQQHRSQEALLPREAVRTIARDACASASVWPLQHLPVCSEWYGNTMAIAGSPTQVAARRSVSCEGAAPRQEGRDVSS